VNAREVIRIFQFMPTNLFLGLPIAAGLVLEDWSNSFSAGGYLTMRKFMKESKSLLSAL